MQSNPTITNEGKKILFIVSRGVLYPKQMLNLKNVRFNNM